MGYIENLQAQAQQAIKAKRYDNMIQNAEFDRVRQVGQQEGAEGLALELAKMEAANRAAAEQSAADFAQSRFVPEGQEGPAGGYVSPTYVAPSPEVQVRADDSVASLAQYAKGL